MTSDSRTNIYENQWRSAVEELVYIVAEEKAIYSSLPEKSRNLLYSRVCELYLRYVCASKALNESHEAILHVQKRETVRSLLISVVGRIIELKHELALLDFSETPFIGDTMHRLKLTFEDLWTPVPLLDHSGSTFHQTRKLVDRAVKMLGQRMKQDSTEIPLTWDEAVVLIQIHERARQGKLRFQLMKQIRSQQILRFSKGGVQRGKISMNPQTAAIKIQCCWRRYSARKTVEKMRLEEMEFLGMIPSRHGLSQLSEKASGILRERRSLRKIVLQDYNTDLRIALDQLRSSEGKILQQGYLEQIRKWYLEQKQVSGKFPEIPSEEDGGLKFIFEQKPTEESEGFQLNENKKSNDAVPADSGSTKSSRKKDEENKPKGVEISPSQWLGKIEREIDIYEDLWHASRGSVDFRKLYDVSLMKENATKQVQEEMRVLADQTARQEIELLKAAADRDKGKKSRKGRKLQRRGAKKSKKSRKDKDLTPDRSLESLVEELVSCGVIRNFPEVDLNHFLGLPSVVNPVHRRYKRDSFGSLGDVKATVIEHCILPLCLTELRDKIPLTRSILFAGPHGAGKTYLVHALCSRVGAVLFDLSSAALMGKYPGKAGMAMLIHLVQKVSKLLAPAVILIEDADRIFMKKAPRSERWDIRRLRKEIPKLVRNINPENPVILVGTCTTPWECDQKGLAQCFQRMIVIPTPDYGSRVLLWNELLLRTTGGFQRYLDLSCLARISDSYTAGTIAKCVNDVITDRRKQLLPKQPLRTEEFVTALSRCEPFYKEEEDSLRSWYSRTPLRRRRNRQHVDDGDDAADADNDAQKKQKKKSKKKKKKNKNGVVTTKKKGIKNR